LDPKPTFGFQFDRVAALLDGALDGIGLSLAFNCATFAGISYFSSKEVALPRWLMALVAPFLPAPGKVIRRRIAWTAGALVFCLVAWLAVFGTVVAYERYDRGQHQSKWYRESSTRSSALVIVVHGWTEGPQDMGEVANVVSSVESLRQPGAFICGATIQVGFPTQTRAASRTTLRPRLESFINKHGERLSSSDTVLAGCYCGAHS
jgi:hypothetical protein